MHHFYFHADKKHLLSKTDARLKILVSAGILAMVLSYKGFAFPLMVAAAGLIVCLVVGTSLRAVLLRFSEPLFIAAVLVMIKLFFTGKHILFTIHFLGINLSGRSDGLIEGLMVAARMTGAVSVVAALGFATPFTEMMSGLAWLKIPRGFVEILMFAYRYIFVLFEEVTVIYGSQKNRLGYSSPRRGISSFGVLAGSLVLKAFEHSRNTAVAMEQRGYDGHMPLAIHQPFRRSEVAASFVVLLIMGLAWKMA